MAKRSLSVLKRIRQAERRRLRNKMKRTRVKRAVKKVREAKSKEEALKYYKIAQSVIDKVAQDRVIHPNKAARLKSKLSAYISKLK